MGCYIGIDGGGTKTLFCLADQSGKVLQSYRTTGISYRQYPMSVVIERITEGVLNCLDAQGLSMKDIEAVCIGYPCYEESETQDAELYKKLRALFYPARLILVNDVVIAWAGALGGSPGVHVVCGTGSIACGGNSAGETARCGGWLDYFSDEGSGFWLGRKAMELFSQQADGREAKGALYDIVCKRLGIKNDFEFIDLMVKDYIPYRDKVASLQLFLLEAARSGDESAKAVYVQACTELCRLVNTLKERLRLPNNFTVTYSGSLFLAEDMILEPFEKAVAAVGGKLTPPLMGPAEGAICLAMKEEQICG